MKLTKIISPTKKRRHHNNKGYARIKRGVVTQQVAEMAERLSISHPHKVYSSQKKGNVLYF
jgi:hypothetical protein